MLKKSYNFYFCTNVPGLNFFWLRAVWYCAESVFSILKFEYLSEIETEFENTFACLSGAQIGLNDEKNWGSKISLDCPFKKRMTVSLRSLWKSDLLFLRMAHFKLVLFTMLFPFSCPKQKRKLLFIAVLVLCKRQRLLLSLFKKRVKKSNSLF